jgi:bifunctional NMN adenylyltransferase/nudix hydrolase
MTNNTNTHYQLDYLVFIGRFEPFHRGHYGVAERALKLAEKVIILIGSANKPRTIRNPWTIAEREVMIRAAFERENDRLQIRPLRDHLYNDALWVSDVQRLVAEIIGPEWQNKKVGLIGYNKDHSSYYLEMFPQWEFVNAVNLAGISASDLRDYLFSGPGDVGKDLLIKAGVPEPVFAMLRGFRDGPQFPQLVREYQFIKDYKKGWSVAPYAPTFVTVDGIVVHSGHVLLVRRRSEPGKGLLAFPGGFADQNETLLHAVIRELREETRLKLPAPVLKGSLKAREVFDHPERSLRGRTVTHAFFFEFPAGELPPVKAGDDATHAEWTPISIAMEMEEHFFEDHYHILEHFLGRA